MGQTNNKHTVHPASCYKGHEPSNRDVVFCGKVCNLLLFCSCTTTVPNQISSAEKSMCCGLYPFLAGKKAVDRLCWTVVN